MIELSPEAIAAGVRAFDQECGIVRDLVHEPLPSTIVAMIRATAAALEHDGYIVKRSAVEVQLDPAAMDELRRQIAEAVAKGLEGIGHTVATMPDLLPPPSPR